MGDYKGNYKGRSDYGPGGKGGVDSNAKGGIPPGIKSTSSESTKKSVSSNIDAGDKGIPPFGQNPTAKAPLD